MIHKNRTSNKTDNTKYLFIITLIINVIFLAYHIFITSKINFNSDGATTSLYAGEIITEHDFFPSGWQYNNHDIWIYNHVIFLVPILKYIPNGYFAYALSTFLFSLLFLFISYQYIKIITTSSKISLFAVISLSTGISSPFISELLYDWGCTYGSNVFIALIIWGSLVKIYQLAQSNQLKKSHVFFNLIILFLVVSIGTISNPMRASLYYVYPFAGGLVVYLLMTYYGEYCKNKNSLYSLLSALLIIGFAYLFGKLIHNNIISPNFNSILTIPSINSVDNFPNHLAMVFKSWLFLFGFPTHSAFNLHGENANVTSPMGIYQSVKIAFSILSLMIPVIFYKALIRSYHNDATKFFILIFPGIAFFLALFVHLFSFIYPTVDDYTSIRYIFTPLLLILISYFVIFDNVIIGCIHKNISVVFFILFTLIIGFMDHVYPSFIYKDKNFAIKNNVNMSIVDCLKKSKQSYGYAGFWRSNVVTILSNSDIKIRPISITKNAIEMYPIHGTKKWYGINALYNETFILFTNEEYDQIDKAWLTKSIGEPSRLESCDNNILAIFNYDITKNLFGNKDLFENKKSFEIDINNNSSRQIGIFNSANNAISAEIGKQGLLIYGPYIGINSGKYKVKVKFDGLNNCQIKSCGYLDIVSKKGTTTLAKQNLLFSETTASITLNFSTLEDIKDLEVRVYSSGINNFSVLSPILIEKQL